MCNYNYNNNKKN